MYIRTINKWRYKKMKTTIKSVRPYTFNKLGQPINSRGKRILTDNRTATFKQSVNNAGARVTFLTHNGGKV